jgi:guanylate kinase
MQGKLIVISAPSGAGKTTIVKQIMKARPDLEFSVSATSRAKRTGETDGTDYFFLTVEEFKTRIDGNLFLEWEEVYGNQYYGTLRSEIKRIWAEGKHVIFDVDVKGGLNIKNQYPEITLAIFISPPSIEALRQRLEGRGTDDRKSIQKRLDKAEEELGHAGDFDLVVVNDNLEIAASHAIYAVNNFLGVEKS